MQHAIIEKMSKYFPDDFELFNSEVLGKSSEVGLDAFSLEMG